MITKSIKSKLFATTSRSASEHFTGGEVLRSFTPSNADLGMCTVVVSKQSCKHVNHLMLRRVIAPHQEFFFWTKIITIETRTPTGSLNLSHIFIVVNILLGTSPALLQEVALPANFMLRNVSSVAPGFEAGVRLLQGDRRPSTVKSTRNACLTATSDTLMISKCMPE
jgi:hypothetical protein